MALLRNANFLLVREFRAKDAGLGVVGWERAVATVAAWNRRWSCAEKYFRNWSLK
jgi:hypothetical protein